MFVCVGVVMGLDRLIGVSWVCVLCVESMLEVERERGIKMAVGKPKKMRLNGWKEIIKNELKNNILIKIGFWDVKIL